MKALFLLVLLASSGPALPQSAGPESASASPTGQSDQSSLPSLPKSHADDLKQELDADALALSKIPADPLVHPDPLAPFVRPIDRLASRSAETLPRKFGATYTFLNQYATITPDSVRHDQLSGRLDLSGAWTAYRRGSTGGSISLLLRSGTNIGKSQQFNLSDSLGSGLYLNCFRVAARRSRSQSTSFTGARISSTGGSHSKWANFTPTSSSP